MDSRRKKLDNMKMIGGDDITQGDLVIHKLLGQDITKYNGNIAKYNIFNYIMGSVHIPTTAGRA
ncbi:MAG TPA: hypothetical protein VFY68_10935 [Nitrososphaeraceae archaeon]|nr:hypothetical protein [Nitrososphaeraceae archaeon]